ncbi:MAG: VCBS repeat-containing protein, partial [Candidatus Krumholzibacteria bacterium]|nr:VCBS repeat-containing protein [Candidatus Krumholzibacteria bacterium]
PSTRYYYVVRAIDESGNRSAASAEFSGSTNPDQMVGWPVQMKDETVSSPVLGDIDGDGDLEIVQGNRKVYAWHHDGQELRDGDANALTWGILTTAGDGYVAPIALAQIDGSPGEDIIAGSRTTNEVYVFDYQGNTLPGWPQPLENPIRAALSVGDLDGDGSPEIIAADEHGVIYVWEPDGVEFLDGDANPSTQGVFYRLPGCTFLYSSPALADMDSDEDDELVVGSQSREVYIFDDDGSILPGWPVTIPDVISGSPAVGDIDGDGDLEIVVNTWSGDVRAFHHDGSVLWQKWFKNQNFFGPSPALADMTGDGKLETFLPSANKKLYCIKHDGTFLPGWPIDYTDQLYTESSPVVADMDGDGSPDVVLGNETKLISAWDVSGNLLDGFPLSTDDALRSVPVVGDVDRDWDVELIAAGWDRKIYVWDFPGTFMPGESHWPSYQGDPRNSGLYGTQIPTGITGVAFTFDALAGGGVSLTWSLPASIYGLFDLSRAVVGEGRAPGEFGVVASGRSVGLDGTLRYVDKGALAGERYVYQLKSADNGGVVYTTGEIYVPVTVGSLSQNYPNPFNPTTQITYYLP